MATIRGWLGGLLPGAAERRAQVAAYRAYWDMANASALVARGPLWVALGDSAAQGVGASAPDRGYVGLLLTALRSERDPTWRVVNLSVSGARVVDVLTKQLPRAVDLPTADLVTCAVGANDLLPFRRLRGLNALLRALPLGAVIATLPRGLRERAAQQANTVIRAAPGLLVADVWARTGPPWAGKYASDHFHPSDEGHRDWAGAFADMLSLTVG